MFVHDGYIRPLEWGLVSPVPRSGRNVALLLGFALTLALFAMPVVAQDTNTGGGQQGGDAGADLGVPGDAPQPAEGRITRVLTFGVIDENCPGGAPAPCWDVTTLVANPGDVVVLHANLLNSVVPHNLHIIEPGAEPAPDAPGPKTQTTDSALHTASLTMPEDGELVFICDVHPDTMVASVVTPATAATSGGHGTSVPALGVHFLAYWVGVIAFAILFIVYGATFFLFKYNETPATTDHWDRSEAGTENKRVAPYASLLAVVIAVAVIAAVIFVATTR
jgi:plastocyanin